MPRYLPLLLLGCWLAAIEPPTGIVALVSSDPMGEPGASAVVVADGLALTLTEVLPTGVGTITVVVPPGRQRAATVERRGDIALLRFDTSGLTPIPIAVTEPAIGDEVWTAGNASGAVQLDGLAAISRGVLSGSYAIDPKAPPTRGRGGKICSTITGPMFETDAAINQGAEGGALLDAQGRLIGLLTLGELRERRLGLAVPAARALGAAGMATPTKTPTAAVPGAAWMVLVRLERTQGLGNPPTVPRPPQALEDVPVYERERLQRWWDGYYHFQQVAWTDAPIPAVVIDAAAGLLLTSASHLHGDAASGRVLLAGGGLPCTVHAIDAGLDLALLKCAGSLPLTNATLAVEAPLLGDQVRVVGLVEDGPVATAGRVSVVGRKVSQTPFSFLQVDARANYATLGGPVIDAAGRLTGLLVLMGPDESRPWYINSGVAMAVDAPTIAAALPRLVAGRSRLAPPVVGLGIRVGDNGRLVIHEVTPGTGAAEAGLKPGDLILSVAGEPVASPAALARVLLRSKAGETVAVGLRRGRKVVNVKVEVREFGG